MRKKILYLFYAVTSGFILLALNQDMRLVLAVNSATEPQYVFSSQSKSNQEQRKKEELEKLRKWAQEFDADKIRQ